MEKGQGESEGPSLGSEHKDGTLQELRSLGEEVGRQQHDSHRELAMFNVTEGCWDCEWVSE